MTIPKIALVLVPVLAMGIPHLIASLERYSTLESLSGQCVVIDGPAFAYHIYYLCLASRSHARRPFEAVPSYAEIGEVALLWLDGLQEAQVIMYQFLQTSTLQEPS